LDFALFECPLKNIRHFLSINPANNYSQKDIFMI